MQSIEERINIANKVFIKNIKKQIKYINETNLIEEVKNNLSMAGELLISSINMYKRGETLESLSLLRNVYEMMLKGIVLDKNPEMLKAYKMINKAKKEEKDSSSEIRYFIAEKFSEYFYVIKKDELFDRIFNKGVLTYLYDNLCEFSHASIIMETLYKIEKEEVVARQAVCVFYVYVMVVFYMDATSVKINKLKESENTILFYSYIFSSVLVEWSKNEELSKLKKYKYIIDLSIEANQIYNYKEQQFILELQNMMKDDLKTIENFSNEEINDITINISRRLEKYCGRDCYKKIFQY